MNKIMVIICAVFPLLCAHSTESLLRGAKGAEFLRNQDYEAAIAHFEEAIRLDPQSYNYAMLGVAHMGKGDIDNAWNLLRRAVRTPPYYEVVFMVFDKLYEVYQYKHHLNKGGLTTAEVESILGSPDEIVPYTNDIIIAVYGIRSFKFKNDVLLPADGRNSSIPPYARETVGKQGLKKLIKR